MLPPCSSSTELLVRVCIHTAWVLQFLLVCFSVFCLLDSTICVLVHFTFPLLLLFCWSLELCFARRFFTFSIFSWIFCPVLVFCWVFSSATRFAWYLFAVRLVFSAPMWLCSWSFLGFLEDLKMAVPQCYRGDQVFLKNSVQFMFSSHWVFISAISLFGIHFCSGFVFSIIHGVLGCLSVLCMHPCMSHLICF